MSALRECPFCGGSEGQFATDAQTKTYIGKWGWWECACGARAEDVRTSYNATGWQDAAIAAWNRRAGDDEVALHRQIDTEIIATLRAEVERLNTALNTPELHDFSAGVVSEAQHQRERWGAEHDAGKAPEDWFWLIGYLAGKALHAAKAGNTDKALHHTISTAAALANWHAALAGATLMRPGIGPGSAAYPAATALEPQGCVSAAPTGCTSDSECAAAGRCLERAAMEDKP